MAANQMHTGLDKKNDQEGMELRRYLVLLRENTRFICVVTVVVTLVGVLLSYALPKKYEAKSTVSVEQNVINDLVKGIAITSTQEAKTRLLKVSLLSRRMLLQVLRDLDMDIQKEGEELERVIESARSVVDVGHDEKKGLFYIRYEDSSPARARDFVNTLTRRYIEESTASKREESYEATRFLHDQIAVFQKRIDEAQAAIDEFKSEKGIVLSLNEGLIREELKDTDQRLEALRIRKIELLSQKQILENAPSGGKLADMESSYRAMLRTYTDKHPDVIRMRDEIAAMRGSPRSGARKNSPEYQRINVELEAIAELEKTQNAIVAKDRALLQELPTVQSELKTLEQRRMNEMHIYEQLVARYGQSEVSKQMELQDKAVSFRVIDPAILPLTHKSPKRWLIMLGSMVLGLGLAGGMILGRDLVYRRIHSVDDLNSLGCPVLVVLPHIATMEDAVTARRNRIALILTVAIIVVVLLLALVEFLEVQTIEELVSRVRSGFSKNI